MKKVVLIATGLLMMLSTLSFSQTVNGIPLKDIDVVYVQIVGRAKLFSTDLAIDIDFGQKNKVFSKKDTRIVDVDGKDVVLHSMVDALNFMCENGYSFVTAYAITVSNQNVYHFLLKKNDI